MIDVEKYPNKLPVALYIYLQNVYPNKEVQPKTKASMGRSYDKPRAQERRRMRSCGPPQMLGVEAPPWSHPKPSYLLPRIRPSPPGEWHRRRKSTD